MAVQVNGDVVAGGRIRQILRLGLSKAVLLWRATCQPEHWTHFRHHSFGNQIARSVALAIQPDGKIVVLGNVSLSSFGMPNQGFTLARYLNTNSTGAELYSDLRALSTDSVP